ncbi:hypothetical protein AGOR_G00070400 [Albula goreensis]|uniref:Uncharacterized protein n=1 Tax=Albula goreensis TaxID=1534307 RepID=A0A8T3DPV2_9TELE|nr:hypothetical protein AGOR_G00070400 [Albula goreensis]
MFFFVTTYKATKTIKTRNQQQKDKINIQLFSYRGGISHVTTRSDTSAIRFNTERSQRLRVNVQGVMRIV